MSVALASRVADAFSKLREAEAQALALREREGADYRTIASRLGVGREGVADLLVAARLSVWSSMHDAPPPPRRSAQCGPARRVLAAQADGEAVSPADAERAHEHVAGCKPCRDARLALREAELACHAWRAAPNRAAEVPEGGTRSARLVPTGTRTARIARRRLVAAVVALVLLVAIVIAAVASGGDPPVRPAAPATGPGSAQGSGKDVVPPPGDKFCPAEQPDCK